MPRGSSGGFSGALAPRSTRRRQRPTHPEPAAIRGSPGGGSSGAFICAILFIFLASCIIGTGLGLGEAAVLSVGSTILFLSLILFAVIFIRQRNSRMAGSRNTLSTVTATHAVAQPVIPATPAVAQPVIPATPVVAQPVIIAAPVVAQPVPRANTPLDEQDPADTKPCVLTPAAAAAGGYAPILVDKPASYQPVVARPVIIATPVVAQPVLPVIPVVAQPVPRANTRLGQQDPPAPKPFVLNPAAAAAGGYAPILVDKPASFQPPTAQGGAPDLSKAARPPAAPYPPAPVPHAYPPPPQATAVAVAAASPSPSAPQENPAYPPSNAADNPALPVDNDPTLPSYDDVEDM